MNFQKVSMYGMLLVGVVSLSACGDKGPKRHVVTGSVTYKSSPAGLVRVTLIGTDGASHTATTGQDGKFSMPGVADGSYKVALQPVGAMPSMPKGTGAPKMPGFGGPMPGGAGGTKMKAADEAKMNQKKAANELPTAPKSTAEIPEKYWSPDKSGLTWDTTTEKNKDFTIGQ